MTEERESELEQYLRNRIRDCLTEGFEAQRIQEIVDEEIS
jgi:hypothetical protein